jgi:hypothetical protein
MMNEENIKPSGGIERFVTEYLYSNTKKNVGKAEDFKKMLST